MKIRSMIMVLACMAVLLAAGGKTVSAEEPKLEIRNSQTLKEVLLERVGKRTTLKMQSGEDIDGTVTMVGEQLIHVSRLTGKDFYDAIVRLDRINAVIIKVR